MKNSNWKRRLFLSYIFIGIVPILVLGAFFYFGNREAVRKETDEYNLSMLSQVLQKLDYVMEKMNSAAYHFSGTDLQEELIEVRYAGKKIDDGLILSQLTTYSEILDIGEADSESVVPFLFLRGDKEIYTMDGKIPYLDFEFQMNRYGDLNSKSFYTLINSTKKNASVKLSEASLKPRQDDICFFIYPIPYMNSIPIASLGFGFTSETLCDIIQTYYDLDSNIFLFNEMQQNIYTSLQENLEQEDIKELETLAMRYRRKGEHFGRRNINGIPYVIMKEVSVNSGITIVTITEESLFYEFNSGFALWYVILLGILILGGIVLAVLLSKVTYKPVGKLFYKILDGETDDGCGIDGDDRNEFEIITTKWNDLANKNAEMNVLINRQRPIVVSSCLNSILEGKYKSRAEMDFFLKLANINLGYRYSFVFLLPISENSIYEEECLKILSAISDDRPYLHLYGLDIQKDAKIAIIVNCPEKMVKSDNTQKDIRIIVAEHISRNLANNYSISIPFYAGRIYESLEDINRSFLEASTLAADYKLTDNRKIILFEELTCEESNMQFPILEQALFIQCIKQANEMEALRALDNMIKEIEEQKSLLLTQCLCFDIINAVMKTLDQLKGFELKNVDIKKVASFTSLADFYEKMTGLTKEICCQFSSFRNQKSNELKSGILDYVRKHYVENSLGLESVAEKFDVSPNYLSRFFKQETGCSFIQYVTMLRMDKAKELLINSDMQIKEIVSEIGYIDSANFVRKFKSYEGITPGQYRERMQRNME